MVAEAGVNNPQTQAVIRPEPSWLVHLLTALPLITMIVTTGWAAITYFNNLASQNKMAEINRSFEIRKPYLQKQFDLYMLSGQTIGNLISKPAGIPAYYQSAMEEWTKFWVLYTGELPLVVDDPKVKEALDIFSGKLSDYTLKGFANSDYVAMKIAGTNVSTAMAQALRATWDSDRIR